MAVKKKKPAKKPVLKANTKRSGGRVVPMKGYVFVKGGNGRVKKAAKK